MAGLVPAIQVFPPAWVSRKCGCLRRARAWPRMPPNRRQRSRRRGGLPV